VGLIKKEYTGNDPDCRQARCDEEYFFHFLDLR
jgi:hypothetical protein